MGGLAGRAACGATARLHRWLWKVRPMPNCLRPALVVLFLALAGCASGPEADFVSPRVSLVNLESIDGTGIQQRYRVTLRVQNQNTFPLSISGYIVNLSLNGNAVADGVSNNAMVLPGLGEALVEVDTTTNAFQVLQTVLEFPGRNSLTFGVNGKVFVQRDIEWTVRFRDNGVLRVPDPSDPSGMFRRTS